MIDTILVKARHQCCICHTHGVQIHHIDGNRNNNVEDNLIPLCGNCHNRVSTTGNMSRNYTGAQLRLYRDQWESDVRIARKIAALGGTYDTSVEENFPEVSVNLESEDST